LAPGVILCEAAMQAGAVLLSKVPRGEGVPVVGRLNDVKLKRMVKPGETVEIEAHLNEQMGNAFFLSGKVLCEGKIAVTLNYVVTLAPIS
jgi:3-hydroxyacyl-[acyl-carrier-protein] dehydratase